MPTRFDNKTFIRKAKEKHGEKYTYDKVSYINYETKVKITCSLHGDFDQTPNNHIHGQGCIECAGKKKLDNKTFIQRAKEKHGEKYTYNKVNYINYDTIVKITCPYHGDFEQTPHNHLNGRGCLDCSGTKKKTTPEFIQQAKEKHGEKYIYDKLEYINNATEVKIICLVHGEFYQAPTSHLHGHGCDKCGGGYKLSTEEFIEKSKKIHGNKYDYRNTEYVDAKKEVKIICSIHGEFYQRPDHHYLSGSGCYKCKMSKGEREVENVLKKIKIKYNCQHKFDDCLYKQKLPFDFVIFINNKIGLIEYQGEQHYKQVDFGGNNANSTLEENIRRDRIKADYAKRKEIPLLLISYDTFDNIEEEIVKFIEEKFS